MDAPGASAPLLACELTAGERPDAARERLTFLLEASEAINASLEIHETLDRVAHLVVPRLADWCSIHLIGDDGELHRLSVHHRDPAKVPLAEELMERQRINVKGDHPVGEAVRTGRPQLLPAVPRDFILRNASDDRDVELYDALGASSAIVAPLLIRDRVLGILALSLGSSRQYAADDLALVELLARRCAVAVDNARLHEQVQDALRRTDESAALVDAVFRAAPVGLGFVDHDLRYVRVNETLATVHGIDAEQHVGRHVRDLVPDLAPLVEPACEKVLTTGDPVTNIELRGEVPADPGSAHDWLASFFPVPGSDGQGAAGIGIILQDVTGERRARDELRQRARQQTAVAELGERALRDPDIEELMQAAVNVVADTLSVDLASLQEFDDSKGVLRVRTVLGYPATDLGYEVPVTDDTVAGSTFRHNHPIVVADMGRDHRFVLIEPRREQRVVGLISVPIRGQESAVGVLDASIRTPREWSAHDVDFLQAVANVVGAAWARADAERELREEQERLGLALEAGHMGFWHWDVVTNRITWSETMEAIMGLEPGTFDGGYDTYRGLIHPEDWDRLQDSVLRALDEGAPHHVLHRFIRADGQERWMEGIGRVTRDEHGKPIAMIGVATDVTEREEAQAERTRLLEAEQAARASSEAMQEQLAFLAEASAVLAESLDYRSVLARVARLTVPRLGDWCSVEVPEEEETETPFVVAHVDPAKVELAHELRRRYPHSPQAGAGLDEVIRTGQPQLYPDVDPSLLASSAVDEDHLAMLEALDIRSAMLVPLVARGRTIGALTLVSSDADRRYDEDDLTLAEELARRSALAIDNARLYRERSHVARTLQQTLLPPRLPSIPGIQIAARYRFAAEGTEIGGDFYDLFETADGAWAIVIGDACGKGPEAAALTGLARHSLRAAAVRERRPARVLRLLNETILDQVADNRFLTMAYARLETDGQDGDDSARLSVACAGHPFPVIVRAAGGVELVRAGGMIVGSLPDADFHEEDVVLGPGDAIVMYTDGVIEARRGDEIYGEERLLELLASCTDQDARAIANAVRQAVGDFLPGLPRDDMAILVLRVLPAAN